MFDRYTKAIVGALMAGLSAYGTALSDGEVTSTEWVVIASAVVFTLGLVWGVPNARPVPDAVRTVLATRAGAEERLYEPSSSPYARPSLRTSHAAEEEEL